MIWTLNRPVVLFADRSAATKAMHLKCWQGECEQTHSVFWNSHLLIGASHLLNHDLHQLTNTNYHHLRLSDWLILQCLFLMRKQDLMLCHLKNPQHLDNMWVWMKHLKLCTSFMSNVRSKSWAQSCHPSAYHPGYQLLSVSDQQVQLGLGCLGKFCFLSICHTVQMVSSKLDTTMQSIFCANTEVIRLVSSLGKHQFF